MVSRAFSSFVDRLQLPGLALGFVLFVAALWADGTNDPFRFVQSVADDRRALLEGHAADIRDLDFDFGKVGSILEAIAYLEFRERFPPPQFAVLANVEYENASGRTLGEIDLAVVEIDSRRVRAVYEIKLTGSPENASRLAERQLGRLRDGLLDGTVVRFRGGLGGFPLEPDSFDGGTRFLRLGGQETRDYFWEVSLDLTRAEGDALQRMVRSR